MKKLCLILFSVLFQLAVHSQADTIFTRKHVKIPCKINEINESEFKYRHANNPDGPLYVISRAEVLKYTLASGFSEMVTKDELSLEHEHQEIIGNRQVIKVHPFSPAFDHFSAAYEKVLKIGTNLDIEAGYINSGINPSINPFVTRQIGSHGMYIKPGVKFFFGPDYSMKGLKYAHPLKGRYIKLDLVFSHITYEGLQRYYYSPQPYPAPPQTPTIITSDMSTSAYGLMINYGRQLILGNVLTFDYYFGAGYTGQSYSYSNPDYMNQNTFAYPNYDDIRAFYNYHGFLRTPDLGISFTFGFRLGYILPDTSPKNKRK